MMRWLLSALIILSLAPLPGCKSSDDTPQCSFENPATLAQSSWPKFRHDLQNTGSIEDVTLNTNPAIRATFSAPSGLGFVASPSLGNGSPTDGVIDQRVYIGSLDNTIYVLDADSLAQLPSFAFTTSGPISSSALITVRNGAEALFVGSSDTFLYALTQTGATQPDFWPSGLSGAISASPNMNLVDGTIYDGSLGRVFLGICPNGIQRFGFSTIAPMNSSPAVSINSLIVVGGSDRQLRGLGTNGFVVFSVTMAGSLSNAPVIEDDLTQQPPQTVGIYAVDATGRLLKVTANGQPIYSVMLPAPVSQSSPALAGNHLYVGDDSGDLHAIDTSTGSIDWTVGTPGPIHSSPAVVVNNMARTVVVASADGTLSLIEDAGDSVGAVFTLPLGAPTQSSPAIRRNSDGSGSIYIGDDSGRVLLIE